MTRDPERTKRRILDAAEREFVAKGIAGARVDAIAERAGTNKRMLYYYFGSKEGLFRAVLRRALSARAAEQRGKGATRTDRLVARQTFHGRAESYVRLLVWEALEGSRRRSLEAEEERQATYRDWVAGVRADQEAGRVDPTLDPAQLVLSELALTVFPVAFPQLTRLITGRSPDDPEFLADRQAFLGALGRRLFGEEVEPAELVEPAEPAPSHK